MWQKLGREVRQRSVHLQVPDIRPTIKKSGRQGCVHCTVPENVKQMCAHAWFRSSTRDKCLCKGMYHRYIRQLCACAWFRMLWGQIVGKRLLRALHGKKCSDWMSLHGKKGSDWMSLHGKKGSDWMCTGTLPLSWGAWKGLANLYMTNNSLTGKTDMKHVVRCHIFCMTKAFYVGWMSGNTDLKQGLCTVMCSA
jgi:hypothetical protein